MRQNDYLWSKEFGFPLSYCTKPVKKICLKNLQLCDVVNYVMCLKLFMSHDFDCVVFYIFTYISQDGLLWL